MSSVSTSKQRNPIVEKVIKPIYIKVVRNWKVWVFDAGSAVLGISLVSRLRLFYLKLEGREKGDIQYWLQEALPKENVFVVQIGSNDGKSNDPLNTLLRIRKKWKALFVEPVPYLFEQLGKRYPSGDRFKLENVAINKGEVLPFYWVDEAASRSIDNLPGWYSQLGSFNRDHIVKHLGSKIEPFILSREIEGISLHSLFLRNNVSKVDVLHIDTEGYDWEILSQLDLSRIEPTVILFEHSHLAPERKLDAIEFLKSKYFVLEFPMDYLCINKTKNTVSDSLQDYIKSKSKSFIN